MNEGCTDVCMVCIKRAKKCKFAQTYTCFCKRIKAHRTLSVQKKNAATKVGPWLHQIEKHVTCVKFTTT